MWHLPFGPSRHLACTPIFAHPYSTFGPWKLFLHTLTALLALGCHFLHTLTTLLALRGSKCTLEVSVCRSVGLSVC